MVMNKKTIITTLIACVFAGSTSLEAQLKYFVKFADKSGTPYTISNPAAFLAAPSIARRTNYNIAVNQSDLPVTPSYVSQVAAVTDVTVLYALKWFNGVVVSIPSASTLTALNAINSLSFVTTHSQVARYKLNPLETVMAPTAVETGASKTTGIAANPMGGSAWQNQQIRVDCLHEIGFRGQGITIAVMDVGFSNVDLNPVFDSLRNRGGIIGTRDFVSGGTNVYEDGGHGAHVLSCLAAIKPNVIMGSAPMADYWLIRTEEGGSEKIIEEYNWVRAAEFSDSVGVDILTTSLGYTTFDISSQNHSYSSLDGKTAPMSIASTMAARKGMFVLTAAGNEGGGSWNNISVAGDADSVCTVGAIDSLSNVGGFSGVGPTADGRIKPDLVARGVSTWIADISGNCFGANGTSFSTPVLAGGVACAWQRNRSLNNIKLLQLLKSSATNAANPNNSRGWGTPDLCSGLLSVSDNKLDDAGINVFPNPFNTNLNITSVKGLHSFKTIQVTDLLGHVLKQIPVSGSENSISINTADLSNGIYFINMTTSSGTITKKIIKN